MSTIVVQQAKDLSQHWQDTSLIMHNVLMPLKRAHQITHFAYQRLYSNKEVVFFTTHPTIGELFIERKLYRLAFAGDINQYTNGYYLFNALPQNEIFDLVHEQGVHHGLIMIKKCLDYCELFYFGTLRENYWINNFYLNNIDLLENFISHFKETCAHIIQKGGNNRLLYPSPGRDEILCPPQLQKNFNSATQTCCSYRKNLSAYLSLITLREKECTFYLKQGLTCKEIARQMHISHRTVEKHIASLKSKLNCKNQKRLIAELLQLTLYSF